MSTTLSEILPEHDFWRACVLGGSVVFLTGMVVILANQAPNVLGIAVILAFAAWWKSKKGDAEDAKSSAEASELDAVEVLRARYASGDIDETEFEDRLDTLLETEATKPREKELSFE